LADPLSVVTVVVTYNGLADTIVCLESLLKTTHRPHAVVVVDNGSSGEAGAIRARFGDAVATIEADRNGGYGAGANLGIRWAMERGADLVWVLNNDTVVPPDTVSRLAGAMASHPEIGMASPQISAPAGPEAPGGVWYAGGILDLARGETRHLTEPLPAAAGTVQTGFLTGCALLVRADVLRQVGLFWERLFLYWEDTDLTLRVQRAGWSTCVVTDAWIHHAIHGGTSSATVAFYHFRNAVLVVWRHAGRRTLARAALQLTYVIARRWASAWLRRRPAPLPETRGLLTGLRLALRWSLRPPRDLPAGRPLRRRT
jgi:GT2 family glycosyltransferase